MSGGSSSVGSTSRHPSSRAAAAAAAAGPASAGTSAMARARDAAAAPAPASASAAYPPRAPARGAVAGNSTSGSSLGLRAAAAGRTSQRAAAPAAAAPAPAAPAPAPAPPANSKRKRVEQQEDEQLDVMETMSLSKAPLVTLTSVPLFYTPPKGPAVSASAPDPQPHLVRLVRVHNHGTHASAAAAVHSQAGASTTAAPAAASTSASASGGGDTETFVRASDLCLTFLQSKSSVHNQVRDFNAPYEKCLMRINMRGGEVCCLTRRGVQRLLQTTKVRALPHLSAWIRSVLLCLMRPGNENMGVPLEALRGASAGQSEEAAKAAHAREDEAAATAPAGEDLEAEQATLAAALLSLPPPSDTQLAAWVQESLSLATSTLRADEERAAKLAAVAAALPSQQPGGSSAGKDWVGEGAANKYEGRHTRMGPRYQAVLPDLFTPQQQSVTANKHSRSAVHEPFLRCRASRIACYHSARRSLCSFDMLALCLRAWQGGGHRSALRGRAGFRPVPGPAAGAPGALPPAGRGAAQRPHLPTRQAHHDRQGDAPHPPPAGGRRGDRGRRRVGPRLGPRRHGALHRARARRDAARCA